MGFEYDAYYIPLCYGATIPPNKEWTLTVLVNPDTGNIISASLYNHDKNRGNFLLTTASRWQLTLFDRLSCDEPTPPDVIRFAAARFQEAVGIKAHVHYSLVPEELISSD